MWEQMMFRVVIGRILGEGLAYGTRSMQRAKRDTISAGLLTGAVILLLCWLGEAVFPPLRMLRQCSDERTWILGKLLLDLLALPVAAPVGGVLAYRCLKRREERTEKADPDPVQVRARKIRRVYGLTVEVLLFAWYCFLTPARWWAEQPGGEMFAGSMGLLAVWALLITLLDVVGGKLAYRAAERRLRGLS